MSLITRIYAWIARDYPKAVAFTFTPIATLAAVALLAHWAVQR